MRMVKTLKILPTEEFKVLKVYSFRDPMTGFVGYVYYLRPLKPDYNKNVQDDFDNKFMEWIKAMNLDNVVMAHSDDIVYEGQFKNILKVLQQFRKKGTMCLTCHGDYTVDEIIEKKKIIGYAIDLDVYWNAREIDIVHFPGGMFTFDKKKEQYFLNVFNSITK